MHHLFLHFFWEGMATDCLWRVYSASDEGSSVSSREQASEDRARSSNY